MNSEVTTMKFNHRYTWKELKEFSSDLQKEYFTRIFTLYKVTKKQIAIMLGIHRTSVYRIFQDLHISPKVLRMNPNYQAWPWETFGDTEGGSSEKAVDALALPETKFSACISNMSITVKATSWQEFYEACRDLPFPTNEINIKIEEVI